VKSIANLFLSVKSKYSNMKIGANEEFAKKLKGNNKQ